MKKNLVRVGGFLLLVAAALVVRYGPGAAKSTGELTGAIRDGRSNVWVESAGEVTRVLADDDEGSRHQRFNVEIASGDTVLIAHNIDLAERAPVERGDRVEFRGEYEWNDKGGVVHWTHHDPGAKRAGGWLRHDGQEYR